MMRGFTLIEIVVIAGVVALIGAISITSLVNSRRIRDLVDSGGDALELLQLARVKAVSGEGGARWGVKLDANRLTLFQGDSFSNATFIEDPRFLPATIELVNIALTGGGQEIVFRRLDGSITGQGSFDLGVKGSVQQRFPVIVDRSGVAYRAGTAPASSGTRIVDGRHRAFALGWSIESANQMILTFSNPDTVKQVQTAGFFNATKTKFDWSGTVSVGGIDQKLRVHTSSLTDTDTTLLIDRDCRFNNKRMTLAMDSKLIVTYEADCRTISVGPYGGVMSEP